MIVAVVLVGVALDAEGRNLDRIALVAARLAALTLGTGLISRSGLVDDPLKVMLCAVNVLLATGAGVPVFGVVVLPTVTVGLLRAVLDLNRQGLGGVMVTVGLKANAVFASGEALNRRLTFGNPLIVAGGLGFPFVGVINPVDAAVRQGMPGRGRRLDVLGSNLIGGADLNLKLALHRHVVGCGNTVLNCLSTHVVIDIARDIGIGGDSVFVRRATIDAIFDPHALGGVVDRHRRRVSLAIIGAVKALGLNILELRAVDAPVETLTINKVAQAPQPGSIRTGIGTVPISTVLIELIVHTQPEVNRLTIYRCSHLKLRSDLLTRPLERWQVILDCVVIEHLDLAST